MTALGRVPAALQPTATQDTGLVRFLATPGASGIAWLVAVHAVIGAVAWQSAAFATLHLLATMGVLAVLGFFSRSPAAVLGVTVYAGVCDVFWRMTDARGPYEASKYALVFGFGMVLIRFVRHPRQAALPLSLLALLLPGAVVGILALGPVAAREYLIANLGGLVAIVLGVLTCWSLRVNQRDARVLFLLGIGPCAAATAVATAATITADNLDFGDSSNFATVGGFGPNQVSSLLGFGALLCILLLLQRDVSQRFRLAVLATGVWFVVQAVLTFSRGGLLSLVLAAGSVALVALTLSGQRLRVLAAAGVLMVAGIQILSWAGAFTDGASDERFSSADTSSRGEIAARDMDVFWDNPVWGVGVGRLKSERQFAVESAAHTEFTRLPAEHGVFGLLVVGLLAALSVRAIRGTDGWYRMSATGLIVLSLSQMTHSATRIGSIAVAFSLAALRGDEP